MKKKAEHSSSGATAELIAFSPRSRKHSLPVAV